MEINHRLKISPTLIVGLGGTGSLGVQYAKRKICKELMGYAQTDVPKKVPFIEYLVMDTTAQEESIAELSGDEHLNLGHINVPGILRGIERDPAYGKSLHWFPQHINPGQIDSGARGVRHIGRLCFFDKLPTIENSLRKKVTSITDYTSVDKVLKERFRGLSISPGSTLDVHIISSLCGGTGSACLLDTAYLIRDIIYDLLKQGTNSTAHLVTTEPFTSDSSINGSSREYIRYNFAVSLSELERFMDFEVAVDGTEIDGANSPWEATYLSGRRVSSLEKPFSITYLLGCKEGESIKKKNICEIIGDAIALQTVHPEGHLLKGLVDNAKAHVINQKDATGKLRAYSSYNTRILSAEFGEQTVELSTYLASKAILDSICANGPGSISGETLKSLQRGTSMQSSDHSLDIDLQRGKFLDLFKTVVNKVGISAERFAETDRFINKLANKNGWFSFGKAGRIIEEKIILGRDRYDKELLICRGRAQEIMSLFDNWVAGVKLELPTQIAKALKEGNPLADLAKTLKDFINTADDILGDLNDEKRKLETLEGSDEAWLRNSIIKTQYSAAAVLRLRAEVLAPVFNSFNKGVHDVREFISTLMGKCERTGDCLRKTREELKHRTLRSSSLTESALWTEEKVGKKVRESTPTLVGTFIGELERRSTAENKEGGRIGFLWDLDPDVPGRDKEVLKVVRDVANKVVAEEIQAEEINFNGEEGVTDEEVISSEEISRFVELAAPRWQIQRTGEDISEISVTNCPGETKLGRIIANIGKSITFSENNLDNRRIIVFRSEHGVSADRLLGLEACMEAVRRKLVIEEKAHINELSLNPEWRIEEPGTATKVDEMYAQFSLGLMFQMIGQTPQHFFVLDEAGSEQLLVENRDNSTNAERSAAFSRLLRLIAQRDKAITALTKRINDQWSLRRKGDINAFKQEVLEYIASLEQKQEKAKLDTDVNTANEVVQLEREISTLTKRVIKPLDDYLKSNVPRNTADVNTAAAGKKN